MNMMEVKSQLRILDQKIASICKLGVITNAGKDDGLDPIAQTEYKGKPINALNMLPYGLCANAPKDSSVLMFALGGSSQNNIGIPFFPENRVRDLKAGEVAVANFLTDSYVKWLEDGSIEMVTESAKVEIKNDGTVFINDGNLEVLP